MKENFLTVKEISDTLKVNKMTIYRYVKSGKLEAYKVGKDLRIKKQDFDKFLNKIRMGK